MLALICLPGYNRFLKLGFAVSAAGFRQPVPDLDAGAPIPWRCLNQHGQAQPGGMLCAAGSEGVSGCLVLLLSNAVLAASSEC